MLLATENPYLTLSLFQCLNDTLTGLTPVLGHLVVEWHRDDYPVASAHPKAVVGHQQGCDAHERETKLACACKDIIFYDCYKYD